jgi:hypothetical protein
MSHKNPYCRLADVQHEASNTDATDAGELEAEIPHASRWVDWYCRRDFYHHDHATTPLRVDESWIALNKIFLPWPKLTLTEVTVDGVVLDSSLYVALTEQFGLSSTLVRGGPWRAEDRDPLALPVEIMLKGTFGYAPAAVDPTTSPSPDIPPPIVKATALVAAIMCGKVVRESVSYGGDKQTIVLRSIPKGVLADLAQFRRLIS